MKGKPETVRPKWALGFASVLVSENGSRQVTSDEDHDPDSAILLPTTTWVCACVCTCCVDDTGDPALAS